uniref:Uncharacterized protein n=1 Tax=Kalanchoe fedtschenkoi TaxID=63787 RepID=A0A7N0T764_KALFE
MKKGLLLFVSIFQSLFLIYFLRASDLPRRLPLRTGFFRYITFRCKSGDL